MNNQEIIKMIIHHVGMAQEGIAGYNELYVHSGADEAKHEFLFFAKPEITLHIESINLKSILEMMFNKLVQYKLTVKDIRLLGASYLEKYDIISRHYGVINALSRKPMDYLSPEALEKFKEAFGLDHKDAKILGSLELLQQYNDFTPSSVDELWQNSKSVKLAGGTYCAPVEIEGEQVFLINGFHPKQLMHFTEEGRSIIAFTLTGNLDWAVARNNFIGKTNPAEAITGSLRNDLLVNREHYGLSSVSSSQNGFHLSAGPVEGLVELMRYCSDYSIKKLRNPEDFVFGRELKRLFDDSKIRMICNNQVVTHNGKRINTFDLTEEKNSETALQLLKACVF
ncbi:MAG: hypothetical protein JXA72_04510 [Bacteroidales bacterium]|nr:hypothetical protein [Bacteroidales bacterium]